VAYNPLYINKAIANNKFNMTGKKHTRKTRDLMSISGKLRPPATKETCQLLSGINQNTVTLYDNISKEFIRTKQTDLDTINKLESGQYVYGGIMRDQESRNRTSVAHKDRKHYYNPETKKAIFIKSYEIPPDGFIAGTSEEYKLAVAKRMTGSNYYHNPVTDEQTRIVGNIIPDGFIRGKNYFGENGNFFSNNAIGIDIRTKEKSSAIKDSNESKFIIPHNVKSILSFQNYKCVNNIRFRNLLIENGININKEKITILKSKKMPLNGYPEISCISTIEYKFSPLDIWI